MSTYEQLLCWIGALHVIFYVLAGTFIVGGAVLNKIWAFTKDAYAMVELQKALQQYRKATPESPSGKGEA